MRGSGHWFLKGTGWGTTISILGLLYSPPHEALDTLNRVQHVSFSFLLTKTRILILLRPFWSGRMAKRRPVIWEILMCLDKRGWGDWEDGGCSPSGEVYVFLLPSSFCRRPLGHPAAFSCSTADNPTCYCLTQHRETALVCQVQVG